MQEIKDLSPVRIDIPGLNEEHVWALLSERAPFARKRMPSSPEAERYYISAIEKIVEERKGAREEITTSLESNLATGQTRIVIRPAVLPKVANIRIQGNSAISTQAIQEALRRVAIGQDYTDYMFREYLVQNVKPLYEEKGLLKVRFPEVSATKPSQPGGDVVVLLRVEENSQYRLSGVDITGEGIDGPSLVRTGDFPLGKVANWKKILQSIENVKNELGMDGYLAARVQIDRRFDDPSQIVALSIDLKKGRQFVFGELRLRGLGPKAEKFALKRWKLSQGQPLNRSYITKYIKEIFQGVQGATSVSQEFKLRKGTNIIDVVISFR